MVSTYPSEKWWSSSVGMMTFPTEWKNKKTFQTTNQLKKVNLSLRDKIISSLLRTFHHQHVRRLDFLTKLQETNYPPVIKRGNGQFPTFRCFFQRNPPFSEKVHCHKKTTEDIHRFHHVSDTQWWPKNCCLEPGILGPTGSGSSDIFSMKLAELGENRILRM